MKKQKNIIYVLVLLIIILASSTKSKKTLKETIVENKAAKQLLQGIWINPDEGIVVFKVKGDTIYYPDSTSLPTYFKIIKDTLIMIGDGETKYPIIKQAAHLLIFKNQTDDIVRLEKSDNPMDKYDFENIVPKVLNQNKLIKRDTLLTYNGERYHCYVQINPTTYKVLKSTYNDDGVEVENVYHDNIINLAVYNGQKKLFSGDFKKQHFKSLIPRDFLKHGILNDIIFENISKHGITYNAYVGIPDSPQSYVVQLKVAFNGKLTMNLCTE